MLKVDTKPMLIKEMSNENEGNERSPEAIDDRSLPGVNRCYSSQRARILANTIAGTRWTLPYVPRQTTTSSCAP